MTKTEWEELRGLLNRHSLEAESADASYLIFAVAEVDGDNLPVGAWVTSGVVNGISEERSEALIAVLEHAAKALSHNHVVIFGKQPQQRSYQESK